MFETCGLRKVRRHCQFNWLGQMEKCIEGNYHKGSKRCVQLISSTKMKSRQGKSDDCIFLFIT